MSRRVRLETDTVIPSHGSSTSDALDLDEHVDTVLQFEGDSNASNLDFVVQVKSDPLDDWARYEKLENIHLTDADTNTKSFIYDTLGFEKLRVKTFNNNSSDSTISIISSKTIKP